MVLPELRHAAARREVIVADYRADSVSQAYTNFFDNEKGAPAGRVVTSCQNQ